MSNLSFSRSNDPRAPSQVALNTINQGQSLERADRVISEMMLGLTGQMNNSVHIKGDSGTGLGFDLTSSLTLNQSTYIGTFYQVIIITDSFNLDSCLEVYVKYKPTGHTSLVQRQGWAEFARLLGGNYFDSYNPNTMFLKFNSSNKTSITKSGEVLVGLYRDGIDFVTTDMLSNPQNGYNFASVLPNLTVFDDFSVAIPVFADLALPINRRQEFSVSDYYSVYSFEFGSASNVITAAFPTPQMDILRKRGTAGMFVTVTTNVGTLATTNYLFASTAFALPGATTMVPMPGGTRISGVPISFDFRNDITAGLLTFSVTTSYNTRVELFSPFPVSSAPPYAMVVLDGFDWSYNVDLVGHYTFSPTADNLLLLRGNPMTGDPQVPFSLENMKYFLRSYNIPLATLATTEKYVSSFLTRIDATTANAMTWGDVWGKIKPIGKWLWDNKDKVAGIATAIATGNYPGALVQATGLAVNQLNDSDKSTANAMSSERKFASALGLAVAMVEHARRGDGKMPSDSPEGGDGGRALACDGCLIMQKSLTDHDVTLLPTIPESDFDEDHRKTDYDSLSQSMQQSSKVICSKNKLMSERYVVARSVYGNAWVEMKHSEVNLLKKRPSFIDMALSSKINHAFFSEIYDKVRYTTDSEDDGPHNYPNYLQFRGYRLPYNSETNTVALTNGKIKASVSHLLEDPFRDKLIVALGPIGEFAMFMVATPGENIKPSSLAIRPSGFVLINKDTHLAQLVDAPEVWVKYDELVEGGRVQILANSFNYSVHSTLLGGSQRATSYMKAMRESEPVSFNPLISRLDDKASESGVGVFEALLDTSNKEVYGAKAKGFEGIRYSPPLPVAFYEVPIIVTDKNNVIDESRSFTCRVSLSAKSGKNDGINPEAVKTHRPMLFDKGKSEVLPIRDNSLFKGVVPIGSSRVVEEIKDYLASQLKTSGITATAKMNELFPGGIVIQIWIPIEIYDKKEGGFQTINQNSWTASIFAYFFNIPCGTMVTGAYDEYGAFSFLDKTVVVAKIKLWDKVRLRTNYNLPLILLTSPDGETDALGSANEVFEATGFQPMVKTSYDTFNERAPYSFVVGSLASTFSNRLHQYLSNSNEMRMRMTGFEPMITSTRVELTANLFGYKDKMFFIGADDLTNIDSKGGRRTSLPGKLMATADATSLQALDSMLGPGKGIGKAGSVNAASFKVRQLIDSIGGFSDDLLGRPKEWDNLAKALQALIGDDRHLSAINAAVDRSIISYLAIFNAFRNNRNDVGSPDLIGLYKNLPEQAQGTFLIINKGEAPSGTPIGLVKFFIKDGLDLFNNSNKWKAQQKSVVDIKGALEALLLTIHPNPEEIIKHFDSILAAGEHYLQPELALYKRDRRAMDKPGLDQVLKPKSLAVGTKALVRPVPKGLEVARKKTNYKPQLKQDDSGEEYGDLQVLEDE